MMIIGQITDCHIVEDSHLFGAIDTAGGLTAAVDRINRLDPAPDVIVVTGDLVNDGGTAQYAHFKSLIAGLSVPVLVLPGNHDDRDRMRAAFGGTSALPVSAQTPFLHYAVKIGPIRLIALDTLDPGKTTGLLCADRLGWLTDRLTEDQESPTVVAMHHPPFQTGMPLMDRYGLEGRQAFEAVVARAGNVHRIIAGHVHRAVTTLVAGVTAQIAPSTAHTLALDLLPEMQPSWTDEPAGLLLHCWSGDARMVTHHLLTQAPNVKDWG